jgi:hypothetical protein
MSETQDEMTPEHKLKLLIAHRPWESEPDREEWAEEFTGYLCEIKRHPQLKHLCGYVTVPDDHPFHGLSYELVSEHVYAYGGITYKDGGKFGFDCAHADDISPGVLLSLLSVGGESSAVGLCQHGEYRTFEWVRKQTEQLARELKLTVLHGAAKGEST